MFKILSTQEIGAQFRAYYEALTDKTRGARPLDYHDLASYADCPARWRGRERTLEDHLDVYDHIVELAAAHPEGFEKAYAVPPASVEATTNVCPGCGSMGAAKRCSKCGVTRKERNVMQPFTAASTAGKIWKAEARKRQRFPLSASRAQKIVGAANALHADKAVAAAAQGAARMFAIEAEWDGGPGCLKLPVRAVISLLPREWAEGEGTIVALGSCQSAHPVGFALLALRRGLHVRAALELDLVNQTPLGPRFKYLVAAAEPEPPHLVARRVMPNDHICAGREIYEQALRNYSESIKQGYWPDYDTGAPEKFGWSLVDPEDALHNQARALLAGPPVTPAEYEPEPPEAAAAAA